MNNFPSETFYENFVLEMADPGFKNLYPRLCFLKACVEFTSELIEYQGARGREEKISELSDLCFWMTAIDSYICADWHDWFLDDNGKMLEIGPQLSECKIDYSASRIDFLSKRLLDLTCKMVRDPKFDPQKYVKDWLPVYIRLKAFYTCELVKWGLTETEIAKINYEKLTERHKND